MNLINFIEKFVKKCMSFFTTPKSLLKNANSFFKKFVKKCMSFFTTTKSLLKNANGEKNGEKVC